MLNSLKLLGQILAPVILFYQLRDIATPSNYSLMIEKKGKKYVYNLTNTDILNLMRAVYKEGKQPDGVTWSLLNRFALLYKDPFTNFSTFIKAYAQPINPEWFPNGKKFKSYYAGLSAERRPYALAKAKERILNAKRTKKEIPEKIQNIIYGVLSGVITNPVRGSVHYVASQASKHDSEETSRYKQQLFAEDRTVPLKPIYYKSSTLGNNWFFSVNAPIPTLKIVNRELI